MKEIISTSVETFQSTEEVNFVEKKCSMIEIGEEVYEEVARRFSELLRGAVFYNGVSEFRFADFTARMTTTLIIRRNDSDGEVEKVLPVWWEFVTLSHDGEPVVNDFDFALLETRIMG